MFPNTQSLDYRQLARAMMSEFGGMTQKAVSSTPTATWGHGRGGLFSTPGLARPVFSAMILPKKGLQSILPVRYSNEVNPLYGIVTGVTDTTGSEPTGVCDDPPVAGLTKLCTHSFVFGRLSRMTRVYNIDRAGEVTNRGEFLDFQVFGDPLTENPNVPSLSPAANVQEMARRELSKAVFELAISWSRDFARLTYTGSPTNNTAGGGHMEFWGLDTLINTGYRDAISGQACAAADSIVRSFNNRNVDSYSTTIVKEITWIFRNLKFLAAHAGLDPVNWAMAMPFGLFYALTDIWPCAYLSYRCQVASGSTQFLDSGEVEKLRSDMRGDLTNYTGQYLLIDGQKIPVVIDDAIPETQNAGSSFTSDIYFVPLTVLGNTPVTYMEYYNMDGPGGPMEMANFFAPQGSFYTSDGGRFLWHRKPPTNMCVQMLALTRPRLLLLTPYLAARLTDITYVPLVHEREWEVDASYYVNGGRTAQDTTLPSYFTPTS